jgi:hypothetical protein
MKADAKWLPAAWGKRCLPYEHPIGWRTILMPYKDKAKQRQAQAESQYRRYWAPGSTLLEYYRDKTREYRGLPSRAKQKAKALELLARATQMARRGYSGTLRPGGM